MENTKDWLIGLTIASSPIVSVYKIGALNVTNYLALLCMALFITRNFRLLSMNKTKAIRKFALFLSILSINGLLIGYSGDQVFFSIVGLWIGVVLNLSLMNASCPRITLLCYTGIGYICCAVAVYQCASVILGFPYFTGQFEFFDLDSSVAGWMGDSYGYRFNSLFSESSYFAIYLLPLFAFSLIRKDYINSFIFGVSLILSSSSTGIIIMAILVLYEIGYKKVIKERNVKLLVCFALLILLCLNYVTQQQELLGMFIRSSDKISTISDGNSESRLFGGIELFNLLPFKELLFGVGLNQMGNYFALHGRMISNYANTFVFTLINSGLCGFIALIIFMFKVFKVSVVNRNISFFVIYIMVTSVDPLLFNQRFYHLLYFVYFVNLDIMSQKLINYKGHVRKSS